MSEFDIEMRDANPAFVEAYKKLKLEFLERLKTNIQSIETALNNFENNAKFTKNEAKDIQVYCHYLSGTGTTFGFPDITAKGRLADDYLHKKINAMPDEGILDTDDFQTLKPLLEDLKEVCLASLGQKQSDEHKEIIQEKRNKSDDSGNASEHILIIDDDTGMADLIAIKLRSRKIRVLVAPDGETAFKLISQEIPDLIILDILMPKMSGHEVLQKLKEDPALASIPVMMLTAQTQRKDVVSALYTGAIDYAVKPVDIDKLVARCEKILESRRYTVLIVDNDQLILQLLYCRYKEEGYNVILASDGKEGWEKIHKKLPDLVILDRMLPSMEGLEVLANMRKEMSTKHIPVIILSARSEQRDIDIGISMGAQDYITKPFIPSDLIRLGYKLIKANHDN